MKLYYKTIRLCLKKNKIPVCIIDYICKKFIVQYKFKEMHFSLMYIVSKYDFYNFKIKCSESLDDYYLSLESNMIYNNFKHKICKCNSYHSPDIYGKHFDYENRRIVVDPRIMKRLVLYNIFI